MSSECRWIGTGCSVHHGGRRTGYFCVGGFGLGKQRHRVRNGQWSGGSSSQRNITAGGIGDLSCSCRACNCRGLGLNLGFHPCHLRLHLHDRRCSSTRGDDFQPNSRAKANSARSLKAEITGVFSSLGRHIDIYTYVDSLRK
jgi:hypothetical protein